MRKTLKTAMGEWLPIVILCVAIVLVYWQTFSSVPTSDGLTWIHNIDSSDWKKIFLPNHLFSEALVLVVKNSLALLFGSISTLFVFQLLNTICTTFSVLLFYAIARLMGFERVTALASSALWGFSFSLWYFANGEIHHFGLLLLLLIFLSCILFRKTPSMRLAVLIGGLHGLANLFHQEHVLMLIPVVWLILYKQSSCRKWHRFYGYFVTMAAVTMAGYAMVGVVVYGARDLKTFLSWFFQFLYLGQGHVMLNSQDHQIFRLIKGSLMSVHYGAQIVVDWMRYPVIRSFPYVLTYMVLTIAGFGILVYFLGMLALRWKGVAGKRKIMAVGLVLWFVAYKLLNYKLSPESPEYHLVSTPPVIMLILFGMERHRSKFLTFGLFFFLIASTVYVNVCSAILPWRFYGEMIERMRRFADSKFKSTDLFISIESGLDAVFCDFGKCISIKDLIYKNGKKQSLLMLRNDIDQQIGQDGRVFLYNIKPTSYALRDMRLAHPDTPIDEEDFLAFFTELQSSYDMKPIIQYWESNDLRCYLFDPKSSDVWQLTRK